MTEQTKKLWTEKELHVLINNVGQNTRNLITLLPKRSDHAIDNKSRRLGLRPKRILHQWTTSEEGYIRENVRKLSYDEIARNLKLTFDIVQAKGYHLLGNKPKRVYSEKPCARCRRIFRPKIASQMYCSKDCRLHCRVCDIKLTNANRVSYRERICKNCHVQTERLHTLNTTQNGVVVLLHNVNKRKLTDKCEVCGYEYQKYKASQYAWHHWNPENPNKGLWVCNKCHWLCNSYEAVINPLNRSKIEKYLELKQKQG